MNELLVKYVNDCENAEINFQMGKWYEKQGYVSPAASFYLRAAEFAEDVNLRYESLIKVFCCYDKAGGRDNTTQTTLKQAIALLPERIEAYFLLAKFHEYRQNYIDTYTYASTAMVLRSRQEVPVMEDIDYDGDFTLYFLKAHSSWHIGKPDQARDIYKYILDNMVDQLNKSYKDLLQTNLSSLGSGSPSQAIRKYKKGESKLRYPFKGSEDIEKNYSQVYQDICALTLLDGKRNGTYLEIGSADPYHGNNTALLEELGWTGIGIEYNPQDANAHAAQRKNLVLCENALESDYDAILARISPNSNIIDYLQVDIEPAKNTFMSLVLLPFTKYKFRFITYEHDHYTDVTKSYRQKSRMFLESLGYKILINDVVPFGEYSFEDWWYHPDLVDEDRVKLIQNADLNKVHNVEDIFLDK